MITTSHLLWIPAGAVVGWLASFVFGDLLTLPVDVYYLVYFAIVLGFLAVYVVKTGLELRPWLSRRLGWGVALGIVGGLVLMRGVLARPETPHLSGGMLAWAVVYRGIAYGLVDGLLLLTFPWVVAWRALHAETGGWPTRIRAGALGLVAMLVVTTAYHLGYRDFRSSRIVLPNVGAAIGAFPTLLTANPVASPVSHAIMHVTAVLHSPGSEIYLPPHRE